MARFRAVVQGNRGAASRLGHSTVSARANSWGSHVEVRYYVDLGKRDCASIIVGAQDRTGRSIFEGTEADLLALLDKGATLRA